MIALLASPLVRTAAVVLLALAIIAGVSHSSYRRGWNDREVTLEREIADAVQRAQDARDRVRDRFDRSPDRLPDDGFARD